MRAGGRDAGDDRRARRPHPRRPRTRTSSRSSTRARESSARATSPPARSRATSARRPSAAFSRSREPSASGSWARAGSAACTAATRARPTSRPTSSRSSRRPVLVACSGAKSLLDIPATMEHLETLGIPVLGYRTDTLPLFYEATGGPAVTQRVEDPESGSARRRGALAARRLRAPAREPAAREHRGRRPDRGSRRRGRARQASPARR